MDDLLDLDFSKSSTSTAGKSSTQANYGSGRSAFDYLAKSSSHSRPLQPPPSSATTRSISPLQSQPPPRSNGTGVGGGGGADAFSSLFGGNNTSTLTSSNGTHTTMTMAERLAKERAASPALGGGYDQPSSRSQSPALLLTRNTSSPSPSLTSNSNPRISNSTPPLRSNNPSPAPRSTLSSVPAGLPKPKTTDPWDFDLLSSNVPPVQQSSDSKSTDPFDLGFDAPSASSVPATTATTTATSTVEEDDFDLLGAFSQPVRPPKPSNPQTAQPTPRSLASSPPPRTSNTTVDTISPPPELLLKLTTELGFPLPEANRALITTFQKTGKFGLEDAVEILMSPQLGEGGPGVEENGRTRREKKNGKQTRDVDEWGDEENVRIGRRRSWELEEEEGDSAAFERERQRRQSAQRGKSPTTSRNGETSSQQRTTQKSSMSSEQRPSAAAAEDPTKVLQDQASEVLAQAQKIGFSMFKSANTYWGLGKEALAKKLEEQRKAARAAAGLPGGGVGSSDTKESHNGKPKWWKEGMDIEDDESKPRNNGKGKERENSSFKDSDDEEGPESVLPQRPSSNRSSQAQTRTQPPQLAPAAPAPNPAEYRSPFRRAKAQPPPAPEADLLSGTGSLSHPSPRAAPTSSASRNSRSAPTPPSTLPSRPPIPRRLSVSISPSVLASAISHKSTGNSHFKLGRFSDASQSYTLALESLPSNWIGRVVLLNNRAQSRLKSGEEKGAVEDCKEVLNIVLEPYGGEKGKIDTTLLEAESQSLGSEVKELAGGGAVDFRDQVGKSLGRRAKGYEVMEKWGLGLRDWETIRQIGDEIVVRGAGGGKLVGDGISRCKKMLDPPPPPSSAPTSTASASVSSNQPRPRTVPAKKRVEVQGSGEAVKALQATQAAQLAEEDLRLQLKDQVDLRINTWKGSKETNLRALIASLDSVLWESLGWKKVGMNELITENQLKVRYVRAIAKVHPDKLNVGNTTVEQRMIAGAVFAALNEAWNATKA